MAKKDKYLRFTAYINEKDKTVLDFIKAQDSFSASMRLILWGVASQLKKRPELPKEVMNMDLFELIDITNLENLDLTEFKDAFFNRKKNLEKPMRSDREDSGGK